MLLIHLSQLHRLCWKWDLLGARRATRVPWQFPAQINPLARCNRICKKPPAPIASVPFTSLALPSSDVLVPSVLPSPAISGAVRSIGYLGHPSSLDSSRISLASHSAFNITPATYSPAFILFPFSRHDSPSLPLSPLFSFGLLAFLFLFSSSPSSLLFFFFLLFFFCLCSFFFFFSFFLFFS